MAECLVRGGTFFEGPRWHEGAWWVSDFYSHRVLRVSTDGREEVVAEVAAQPSGLGFLPDGTLLIVSMKDRRVLRRLADGTLTTHADLSDCTGGHANDMVVDGQGRAWVGNFGFDIFGGAAPAATSLLRVDADGAVSVAAEGLMCPNGTVISADGRTLVVAESFAARLTAFTITADASIRRETRSAKSMSRVNTAAWNENGRAFARARASSTSSQA